tara:strand:- start:978 stop:1445 length:468 start_codon:yes stop_codon:yes gene_type:complete
MFIFDKKMMKKKILILFTTFIAIGCSTLKYYGEKINSSEVQTFENVNDKAYSSGIISTKISGTIIETCPKKGCWMSMATNTDTLFVRFRNYGFFVPTNGVEGKTAIIEGDLFVDTISVKMLQHYAKDAGKSKEEIQKITEPQFGLAFTADGVIIR